MPLRGSISARLFVRKSSRNLRIPAIASQRIRMVMRSGHHAGEPEEPESLNSQFQEPLGMLPNPGNCSPRLFLIEGHLSHARFFSADVAVQQGFKPLQKALPFILMVVSMRQIVVRQQQIHSQTQARENRPPQHQVIPYGPRQK